MLVATPANTSIIPTAYCNVNSPGLGNSINDSAMVTTFRTDVVITVGRAPYCLTIVITKKSPAVPTHAKANSFGMMDVLFIQKNIADGSSPVIMHVQKRYAAPRNFEQKIISNGDADVIRIVFSWTFPTKASATRASEMKKMPIILSDTVPRDSPPNESISPTVSIPTAMKSSML
eukprot:374916_1